MGGIKASVACLKPTEFHLPETLERDAAATGRPFYSGTWESSADPLLLRMSILPGNRGETLGDLVNRY